MFGDLNRAEVIGNITNDLQLRYTGGGTAVVSFGLATNRRYKAKNSDEWTDDTTFHNIVVWARQAEMLSERARKGTRIFVSGRLQTRTWDDQDGKKNYKTEIVANEIILLDRYEKGPSKGTPSGASETDVNSPKDKKTKSKNTKKSQNDSIIDPDDLPF